MNLFPAAALQFISITKESLIIYPNEWKQQTVHDLKLVLTDGNANSVEHKFKLTVTNSAPIFKDRLKSVKMLLNEEFEYIFPKVEDLEYNPVEILVTCPSHLYFDPINKKIDIKPTNPNYHLGYSIIKVVLSDSRLTTEYKFSLTVENRAPYFEKNLRDIKLSLNSEFKYKLPLITDKENLPVRVTISMEDGSRLPPNINFNDSE